ncbi:hypothetical protein C1638_017585 [Chryseobacterium oncorhynchi]|uniref:Uncharacterized protein n=2 Tax=Chryseobacterium oncorhynchi TaxID=741074 RepID=A0A316WLN9_9FLAO|nr:hypothetical protein C1638_017585 [Chryseobacterium oncorhynchi]
MGAWFAARRKNLADTQTSELENVEKAVTIFREQHEYISNQWKEATDEANKLNSLYKQAIAEIGKLEDQVSKMERINSEMQKTNSELIEQNKALITELQKYKQLNGKTTTP